MRAQAAPQPTPKSCEGKADTIVLEALDPRKIAWDVQALRARVCPFCATHNHVALIRPDQLPVAFCETCGCWYVAKLPPTSEITKVYEGYYDVHRATDLSERSVSCKVENASIAARTDWQLQTISRLLGGIRGKRILDVGCGWGGLLLKIRSAGGEPVGCDLSPEACEFANNRLGIRVHQSDLPMCSSAIGNVDAVAMRDFIEHPVEPIAEIEAAYEILKPGGLLLLHTPNAGEAGTDVETARNWVGFRVDLEHLQYLSPHTVNWLAREYGLRIERLGAFGFPGLKRLKQLAKLPNRKYGSIHLAREIAKKIPGMRKAHRCLRVLRSELAGEPRDPRLGSYHLFAVVRKE